MPSVRPTGPLDRVPAPLLFVVSGLTQYLGAAIAVGLFSVAGALDIAWLRIAASALLLLAWARPWRKTWTLRELALIAPFGLALAAMNITFYVAIEVLPLGTAVAIEFCGPVAVAALTGAGWRERGAIALAAIGVALLAGVTIDSGLPRDDAIVGLIAIAIAAGCWAAYILLGRRVAARSAGLTSLSVGMTIGALAFAPLLAPTAVPVLTDWRHALAIAGIGLLSSVVPYGLEQLILRRVSVATFSVLVALLPATAAIVGAVALRQVPSLAELAGLLLVSGAIVMTARGPRNSVPSTDNASEPGPSA